MEDICKQKQADQLYAALAEVLKEFIVAKVSFIQKSHQTVQDFQQVDIFLSQVQQTWRDHCAQLSTIRNIFLFLDRNYALQSSGVQVLWDLGQSIFRAQLDALPSLLAGILSALLRAIAALRSGALTDGQQIGQLAQMLMTLQLYQSHFQQAFLQDAARFFGEEGERILDQLDVAQFLLHVDRRLNEAVELTTKHLDASSRKPLLEVVESYLLAPHVPVLLERGAAAMLAADQISDLKRMYLLFERVHAVDKLRVVWSQYIKLSGEAIVSASGGAAASGKEIVEDVIALQERLLETLNKAFFGSEAFRQSMKSAFDYFLNLNMRSTAEAVARYLDRKMRDKVMTEVDAEKKLEQVMTIFKFLQEKDIFEAFYKKHLAKRLLTSRSSDYDLERSMLLKLKAECGANFTSKLEGMFQDIEMSRECERAFLLSSAHQAAGALHHVTGGDGAVVYTVAEPEATIQVLTTGYWPNVGNFDGLQVPLELAAIVRRFDGFYNGKYQGRRLVWAHGLARCLVTYRLAGGGKKELEVSMLQALVLRCFAIDASLGLEDIAQRTGIGADDLKLALLSLCIDPKARLLLKAPVGQHVSAGDRFTVNDTFSHKQFHIKINTLQVKETTEEVQRTHEEVFRDREYQVDAAIVRTMKSRKRLAHSSLISELMSQLRFPAQSGDLKKRIEALIERDFLERDPADPSVYNYLA